MIAQKVDVIHHAFDFLKFKREACLPFECKEFSHFSKVHLQVIAGPDDEIINILGPYVIYPSVRELHGAAKCLGNA